MNISLNTINLFYNICESIQSQRISDRKFSENPFKPSSKVVFISKAIGTRQVDKGKATGPDKPSSVLRI